MNDDTTKKDLDQELEVSSEELESGAETSRADDDSDDVVFDEESELGPVEIVKKLRVKLKAAIEEKQKYLDNWQRDKAEFVNARKRDEESKAEFLKFSKQGVIEEILPVLDSFDMAMGKNGSTTGNAQASAWENVSKEWKAGIEGIYNQLLGILSKHGVAPFGAAGDAFDPNLHHSIGMVKTEDATQDHKVAEVLQKGYTMAGKVVRPALVKVWEI